jgi:hypothetical protein
MTEVRPCYKAIVGSGFMVSHPSRKNKDAARMGHPATFAQDDSGQDRAPGTENSS